MEKRLIHGVQIYYLSLEALLLLTHIEIHTIYIYIYIYIQNEDEKVESDSGRRLVKTL